MFYYIVSGSIIVSENYQQCFWYLSMNYGGDNLFDIMTFSFISITCIWQCHFATGTIKYQTVFNVLIVFFKTYIYVYLYIFFMICIIANILNQKLSQLGKSSQMRTFIAQPAYYLGVISRTCSYVMYCWPLLRFNILKIRVVIIMIEGESIFTRECRWYKFRWSDLIICYVFLFHRTLKRISPMFTFLWSDSVFHWFFWFVL